MAISIVDYQLPYDTHNEYDVTFYGDRIHTMLTNSPAMVESWLSTITLANPNHRIVGLDVEWRPNFSRNSDNPIATLQLCTGPNYAGSLRIPPGTVLPGVCLDPNCLIFQVLHSESIPQSLTNFLANPAFTFVGVGIESDCEKLLLDYGLRVANAVDLRGFAALRLGVLELGNAGLKRLASAVLGKELQKPKRVTMSRWDSQWLTYDQIQYAAVDAFIAYEIARQLNLRGA
ncbi:Werner Syndrome-like exonuclease [Pyrus x bretschneideri]|uniref:Werner Syndrome-like exonuclease n=1 Tax=Pyrus x bretschneideri TaxID=225117 RepID=UPI0020304467|nr:Werner Syndrome-like exonuclease [Pyrus x bretschneideri]